MSGAPDGRGGDGRGGDGRGGDGWGDDGRGGDGRGDGRGDGAPGPVERRGTGFWSVARSVGAAMIGVQSSRNRERDFTEGKPLHFVIGGLVGTALFLLAVWLLVQYLIATS